MRFNPTRFNRHLANMGQAAIWQPSYGCSCISPTSGAPATNCKLCSGKGRIWDPGQEVTIGLARQQSEVELAQVGAWDAGDMVATIPANSPAWRAGQYDRVSLRNATDRFSQPLTRGAVTEKLLFVPERIERCFWKHPTTQALIEGGIPLVAANGTLSWPDGGEPPPGMTYSLTGLRYSEYFIFGTIPSNRNMHSGMALPKRVQLRRWDLFGR